ncbi:MAG: twin-arginine translocase TatA/TatE family subunit, partial [Proteobacteria bacterium]|nr:twin-arginine translocase TatA/TatE family subunit [Pseudomonadota bacterium]
MLAAFGLPGGAELIIILVIGLLLFGSRLPSVGRNIGKSITEFKKGMKEAGEELTKEEPQSAAQRPQLSSEQMERATEEALRRLRA